MEYAKVVDVNYYIDKKIKALRQFDCAALL